MGILYCKIIGYCDFRNTIITIFSGPNSVTITEKDCSTEWVGSFSNSFPGEEVAVTKFYMKKIFPPLGGQKSSTIQKKRKGESTWRVSDK